MIQYLIGDATEPCVRPAIIAHICNDIGLAASGFIVPLYDKYPMARLSYETLYRTRDPKYSLLGRVDFVHVADDLIIANMIAQHETIRTNTKPIDFTALMTCLRDVNEMSLKFNMTVHMPRIGACRGGASWEEIEPIIQEEITVAYIYTLPNEIDKWPAVTYQQPAITPVPVVYDAAEMRRSEIMLAVQTADKFPIHVKIGRATAKIPDKKAAEFFSLGMLMMIEEDE